jgi:thiamine biosynthesis protein ThiI
MTRMTGSELPRRAVVVHYGEIGTKGNNRPFFENQLQKNLLEKLEPRGGGFSVECVDQRLLVRAVAQGAHDDEQDEGKKKNEREGAVIPGPEVFSLATTTTTTTSARQDVMSRVLKDLFGVAWFASVVECPLDYQSARAAAVDELEEVKRDTGAQTFRVTSRRANKRYELSSQQMAVKLGADLMKETGLSVDLSNPQATLFVDILSDRILLHTSKVKGPGGLPVGVTGKVLHLLSGGIDSPVAAWLMMKRGCLPTYLHFFVAPDAADLLRTKMVSTLRQLSRFGIGDARLVLVPFSVYQVATSDLRNDYEPIVFRHFMRVVAEKVAGRLDAIAISTGDNLGQVASQTLYNLACIDAGASMPTLRPLVGYDKSEIVRLAETIGTYRDSILDYRDCCSIVSRHPRTRMRTEDVLEAARRYDFHSLAEDALSAAEVMKVDGTNGVASIEPLEPAPLPRFDSSQRLRR